MVTIPRNGNGYNPVWLLRQLRADGAFREAPNKRRKKGAVDVAEPYRSEPAQSATKGRVRQRNCDRESFGEFQSHETYS